MALDSYLGEGAFVPETTAAMGEAFEAVCSEFHLAHGSKELVATRIIAAARQGELDPVRLRMKAVVGFFPTMPPLIDSNRNIVRTSSPDHLAQVHGRTTPLSEVGY